MSDLYKFLQRAKIYIAFEHSFLTENSDFPKSEGPKSPKPQISQISRSTKNHKNLGSFGVDRNPEIIENQDFPDFPVSKSPKMSAVLGRPKSESPQKSGKSRFMDGQKPINNIGQIRKLAENYEK